MPPRYCFLLVMRVICSFLHIECDSNQFLFRPYINTASKAFSGPIYLNSNISYLYNALISYSGIRYLFSYDECNQACSNKSFESATVFTHQIKQAYHRSESVEFGTMIYKMLRFLVMISTRTSFLSLNWLRMNRLITLTSYVTEVATIYTHKDFASHFARKSQKWVRTGDI